MNSRTNIVESGKLQRFQSQLPILEPSQCLYTFGETYFSGSI